ncbi:MAG TPA: ATP-dependent helicase C-terminal domain-containing protein, partial [Pyrinomonadaceae bacterium]|nr:ATP-dependent helicase C-terminal domain-containing protein [Pyrinomonadaceae bacterium]
LKGVGCVVLDEFHERHLQADLALALLKRLQGGARPDLKLVAMSATLEAAPLARYLGGCPVLRSEGRRFDVSVEHLARPDERPLALQVEQAVRRLIREGTAGDVLVFLPGAAEIRRAREACAELAEEFDLLLLPLHGELSAEEQDRAVRPSERRKVILSTNVAETSITIEGVGAVVDSGLARVAGHSPWSGLPVLQVARTSRASAAQRAGRAGRTRAGRCLRLYTAQDFNARPDYEQPEVTRLDLAETALELHASGVRDLARFEWFEAPPGAALDAAETLLRRLDAITEQGEVTGTGRRMLRWPLHPRLSRLVVEAERRGVEREACLIAALISERDIRAGRVALEKSALASAAARTATSVGSSDLLELSDLFIEAARARFAHERLRARGLDAAAVRAVERVRRSLVRAVGRRRHAEAEDEVSFSHERETELLICILAGYPDRVARRRDVASTNDASSSVELLLAGGGAATLAPESVVRRAPFLVAVDAEARRVGGAQQGRGARGGTVVRLASAIEPDWLLDLFIDRIAETTEVQWNAAAERVETIRRMTYEGLVLDETRASETVGEEVRRLLAEKALEAGLSAFADAEAVERFLARVEFAARTYREADFPSLDEGDALDALARLCEGRRSFAELREAVRAGHLQEALRRELTPEQARLLASAAPERVTLARSRQVKVNYERGKPPWVASRLQDFFGMRESPKIAGGRASLVLHLLAPNQRPVQLTSDLAGFWERHYPQVRRELSRRYPRHAWPDDPLKPEG